MHSLFLPVTCLKWKHREMIFDHGVLVAATYMGSTVAVPSGPWTYALCVQGNWRFFIEILCWAPYDLHGGSEP